RRSRRYRLRLTIRLRPLRDPSLYKRYLHGFQRTADGHPRLLCPLKVLHQKAAGGVGRKYGFAPSTALHQRCIACGRETALRHRTSMTGAARGSKEGRNLLFVTDRSRGLCETARSKSTDYTKHQKHGHAVKTAPKRARS